MMNCLACGTTGSPASREHVFAQWLIRELNTLGTGSINLYRRLHTGESHQLRPYVKLESLTLKRVCEKCNNGWMGKLEERAKPLITALLRGERDLSSLEDMERGLLTKWAGKTAIIESHAVGAECPIDAKLLRWMRTHDDDMPGRFGVAACSTEFNDVGHMQIGIIRDLIGGGTAAGNVVMLILPKLALLCIFPMLDEVRCDYRCAPPLRPLWPDARSWGQIKGSFGPLELNRPDVFFELAERIEIFHNVVR